MEVSNIIVNVFEIVFQKYDSYENFRSYNLNMSVGLETSPIENSSDIPSCLFYNSTLRWMDKVKVSQNKATFRSRQGQIKVNIDHFQT